MRVEKEPVCAVAVIGAGLMGHGIAMEFAAAGYEVRLNDESPARLDEAKRLIHEELPRLSDLGVFSSSAASTAESRISICPTIEEAAENADLVVEAVFEDLALKRRIFAALDRCCPPRTILASNTSTIQPSDLASATGRPDRVINAHYFNPPYLIPLVEVVRSRETSDATVETLRGMLVRAGKQPVVLRKEIPGFVVNRLQIAVLREAASLVERGVVTAPELDLIMRSSCGRRWSVAGVFEVFELAGWDLLTTLCNLVSPTLCNDTSAPRLLLGKIARGELGVKTGKGFYDWTRESACALKQRIAHALVEIERWSGHGSGE
jgi:3-hydroxybutyryl-CoA dehydrogenase